MVSPALRIAWTAGIVAYALVAIPSALDRMSRSAPALEGAVLEPFRAQADRSAAMTAIVREEPAEALRAAQAAVAHDPIDPDSVALLGSAYQLAGQTEAADRAFRVAALFGWRNLATQSYFFDVAIQRREFEVAANRVDAMMRTHPRLVDMQDMFDSFERDEAGRKVLADHLAQRPSWIEDYVKSAAATPETVAGRESVISLVPASPPIGCGTISPLVNALVESGERADAVATWNRHCPSQPVAGPLGDPGFANVPLPGTPPTPFTWSGRRSGDVAISNVSGGDGGLKIRNSARAPRLVISQRVQIAPGPYKVDVKGIYQGQSRPGVIAAFGCAGRFPLDLDPDGNALSGGQLLVSSGCAGEELGLWLQGNGASVQLDSIALTAAN